MSEQIKKALELGLEHAKESLIAEKNGNNSAAVRENIRRDIQNIRDAIASLPPASQEDAIQALADQAQELDMGYGKNACPTCGRSQEAIRNATLDEVIRLYKSQRYMVLRPLEPCAQERVDAIKEHDRFMADRIERMKSQPSAPHPAQNEEAKFSKEWCLQAAKDEVGASPDFSIGTEPPAGGTVTDEQFDKLEEFVALCFKCARYERPSMDWIEAGRKFVANLLQSAERGKDAEDARRYRTIRKVWEHEDGEIILDRLLSIGSAEELDNHLDECAAMSGKRSQE